MSTDHHRSEQDELSRIVPFVPSGVDQLAALALPQPRAAVWARIEHSLTTGVVPTADPFAAPRVSLLDDVAGEHQVPAARPVAAWWSRAAVVAACAGLAGMLLRPSGAVEAGMISGSMVLSPTMPRAGERVQVRYTAGAQLGRPAVLRLRARVRTVHGENYVTNEPVISLGTLTRIEGNRYDGAFVLPDSFVYAALAVEDTAAREVDDLGGRTWEVLRAEPNGNPTLDALVQRTNDLMGRSWEEGMAGVRRMITLYPDSVVAWRWLQLYESWMAIETDSTRAVHRRQLERLAARDRGRRDLSADALSDIVWYARGIDSTLAAPWIARQLRDAPTHSTGIYLRGLGTLQRLWNGQIDTTRALADFEALWPTVTPERAQWVAGHGADLAGRDSVRATVWVERLLAASKGPAAQREAAQRMLDMPTQRARGEAALRALLRTTSVSAMPRLLDESAGDHVARVERSRRATLATLGQALAKDRSFMAARDTLALATADGWDVTAFGALGDVRLVLGDTSGAVDAWAPVAIDPRTPPARQRSLDSLVRRVRQESRWADAKRASTHLLARRVMERATRRHVDDVILTGIDGTATTLSALRGARATVVLFWSHECGYAVEAVEALQALARRLTTRGIPFVFVADAARLTPELAATLRERKVTVPVYLDATGRGAVTFNNWGTPMLYVLDAKGRVAFPGTSDASQVLLYAEAVLSAIP